MLALLLPVPAVFAANQTWNGTAGDGKWSTVGNWVGTPAAPPGSTSVKTSVDVATFNGTETAANTTVTIDSATQNIGGISFGTTAARADTIGSLGANGGNSLFLTSAGTIQILATETNAITETINAPLLLEGAGGYTFADLSTNAGSSLVIAGNVALDTGASASVLTVTATNPITISGIMANGGATLSLTANGAGLLTLTGANTYTGTNILGAGTISLGVAEIAGTSGPLGKSAAANAGNIQLNGGTLQYTAANQFDYSGRFSTAINQQYRADVNGQNVTWATNLPSTGGAITLSSTAGGGTLNLTGANTFTGGVTINNGTLQVGSNSALNFNNVTSTGTAQNVTLANNGALAINGFNTTIQNLTGSVNTIVENSNNTGVSNAVLSVNSAATTTFAGTLQDGGASGTLGLTKNGINNLVLSHANTFTGPTTVNAGVLAYFIAGSQGNTSGITLNAGGTFTDGPSATVGVGPFIPLATLAPLITAGSTGTFGIGFNNPDSTDLSTILTAPVFLGAGSGNFSTFNGIYPAIGGNYHFGGGGVGQLAINSSGTGGVLSGANGVIVQGILKTSSSSTAATLSSWNTLANNGTGGNGGGAATFAGAGTIELQGQNTYTGDTQLNIGPNSSAANYYQAILQVNNNSVVSGGALVSGPIGVGNLHISGGAFQDGGLNVVLGNNVVLDGNTTFSSQGNGSLIFSPVGLTTAPTFAISNSPSIIVKNLSTTIADNITGTSNLATSGIGSLVLTGNNTFTGNITINPATMTNGASNGNTQTIFSLGWGGVQFNSPAAIGNAANVITVNSGAYAAAGPTYTNLQATFFNRIASASTGTIALTASTADNFDWSLATGANLSTSLGATIGSNVTYSGTLTPNGTTYRLGGGGGSLTVTSLLSGANSVSVFPSNQTASSALSMNGTLVLAGANTYSGGTIVSGTDLASYLNPANGNNGNPGNLVSNLQIAGNSAMSGGTLNNGPLGVGTVTFVNAPAIQDNGTNVIVANSIVSNTSTPFNTAFTSQPMAFNSAGNGSLTLDGGPSATINIATTAAGQSWAVNNFTTIKDTITAASTGLVFSTGNQYFTISGTGTLVLADQGTWMYKNAPNPNVAAGATNPLTGIANPANIITSVNQGTLLVGGPALRLGSSSTVTGAFGSQTVSSGPLGIGPLLINGAGNVGTFLQDNGSNVTIANSIFINTVNPLKTDSTGNGSITFDGSGLINPAAIAPSSGGTLGFLADNTVIVNDRIVNGGATGAILTIGNNNNTFPYGTVILNQPANATAANALGSTYSGAFNANFGTVVLGANSLLSGASPSQTLVSGPAGIGTFTIAGNFPLVEDNGTAITVANNMATGGNLIFASSTGGGSLTFDGTGRTAKATFNLSGTGSWLVNNTVTIADQVTSAQQIIMLGTGKLVLANASGTNSTYQNTITNSGVVQINNTASFGVGIASVGTLGTIQSTVNYGGTLAAGPTYAALQTTFFNKVYASSTGTVALTANSADLYNFSSTGSFNAPYVSLGAVGGTAAAPIVYSGTITPNGANGGIYRLGGGGGVLDISTQTLDSTKSLLVGGGGSGGIVQLANVFTGSTAVNAGTLELDTAPGAPASFPGIITLRNGSSISTGASYGTLTGNLLPLINSASVGTVALSGDSAESLDFTNLPFLSLGAEATTSPIYSGALAPVGGTLSMGGGGGALTVSTTLTGSSSLTAFAAGSGGTLIPTGPNTYSGGTTLLPGAAPTLFFNGLTPYTANDNTAGVLQLNTSSTVTGTFGSQTLVSGPIGTSTLTLAGGKLTENGTAVTVANSVVVAGSTTLSGDTGSFTFDGTGLSTPATFAVNNGSVLTVTNTTTINDAITGNTGFSKAGAGTLILGGANSYSGPTSVLGGTLRTTAAGALPSGTTLNIALGRNNSASGTVDLNGTSQSVNALLGTGIVTNNSATTGALLTIGAGGGSGQFYGIIQDGTKPLSITKSGAGVLTLGSANTYTGGTTVSNGTLRLAPTGTGILQMGGAGTTLSNSTGTTMIANGPVGTGLLTLGGGTTLQDSGYATNLANEVSVSGTVTFSSPSTSSAFGSPNSGSLVFDDTVVAGHTNHFQLTGPTTLNVNNTTTIADQITGANALTMGGSGTLILSSATQSTYTTMTVNSGVVQYNATTSVGSGGAGSITVGNAGTAAIGPGIGAGNPSTPIGTFLPFVATSSSGTLALTGNDSENASFSGYANLSLGATGSATYSGTLTPNGTTYLLGGGGGTLTVTSALSGSNSLVVGGNTAGGGSGGTVVLTNPLNSTTSVNGGVLQLTTVGTGNITVNNGGAVAAAPTYDAANATNTPITTSLLPRITTGSAGTLALIGNSSENLNLGSYPNLSLGAAAGASASYSGTLTPAGTNYRLGGGGGTLTMNSTLTGGSNSLVVNGSGSGGNVILGGTGNNYGAGTTVVKGSLTVGPNPGVLGTGTVTLSTGSTLTILPFSAPLAATGYNYDEIVSPGESSVQSGVNASFGDNGYALYQKGIPGSQGVGNIGLPASRSFASIANPDTVFQLQPYNAKNALKLGIGNANANAQSYSPQGTLTLANPGGYQNLSILNGSPFGATFFEVQLNFADGTSALVPNTTSGNTGNLPNYYAADWTGPATFNLNTANYKIAYLGAGSVTQTDNNGTFQGGLGGALVNNLAAPSPKLYETDVTVPAALQSKTLTSVTIIDTGAFNGNNNSTDYLHATNQLNIMGLSGTLVGSNTGAVFYSNSLSVPAGAGSTIDVQNTQGVTFNGSLTMGDGSTLNLVNSLGSVNDDAVGTLNVQVGTVLLPTTGAHTATFNAGSGGQTPVNLVLGTLDDGSTATPATINVTGPGFVTAASGASNLQNGTHLNLTGGGTLIVTGSGIGNGALVNVAAGANLVIPSSTTIDSLAGTGTVQLSFGANNGTLTVGASPNNLSVNVPTTFIGNGTVQNGGNNNTLTLSGGNFANTAVNTNGFSSTVPAIVANSTLALGNTITLSGGVLQLKATPGTATMTGFGGNFGVYYNGFGSIVTNGWTVNSNGPGTDNGAGTTTAGFRTAAPSDNISTPGHNIFPSVNVLRLTDGGANEGRTAFYNTPVPYAAGAAGFTASFTYTPSLQMQADGIAFLLQNDPRGATALGGYGSGKGYGFTPAQGAPINPGPGNLGAGEGASITNSIAVNLDIFNGSPFGTGTALGINGAVPPSIPVKWLNDGDPINVTVAYNPVGQTITETLTDTLVPANVFSTVYTGVNLASILNGGSAYVGFSGGTGGQFVDSQISNFSYTLAGTTPGAYATGLVTTGSNGRVDLAVSAATPAFSLAGGISGSGGTLPISAMSAPGGLNYSLAVNGPSALTSTLTLNVFHAGALNGGGTDGTGTGVGTVTFNGQISGAGGIVNNGPGNVVLAAFNTYTGGTQTNAASTVAAAPGALGTGAVTLNGGTLQLRTAQPYAAIASTVTPVAASGWNEDVIVAANQTPATVFSTLASFDGGGASHAPGNVLYESGTPGSPGGTGMPAAPSPGVGPSIVSAFNSNVTFQFQPYSTVTGALSNNDLQLNSATVTATLALTNPGAFGSLAIMHSTGNGAGEFSMQLNFKDAAPLLVSSIASPDWFNGAGSVFSSPGVGRYGGGTNFNSGPANPRLYETDYTLPLAYQGATLQSITFDYLAGGQVNIMGVSGDVLTNSNINAVNITADSTIDVTGTATSGLAGLTTIGTNTLHVTGGSTGSNAAYTLSLGTTGGVTLTGNPIFNVANNGSGIGTLVLGALNDQGSAKTLEFSGTGATTVGTAATSLVAGTVITIDAGATLNSNAAGTAISGGSLGQFAQVGNSGTFNVGASQTIGSLSGAGSAFLGNGVTLGVGNSNSLTSIFSGVIGDGGAGSPGSLNVGVAGSSGSLTLTNLNTYHGTTTVSGGSLILQTAGTNNIANSSTISVLSGGTLNLTGVTGGFTVASGQTLQGASVLGGAGGGTVNGSVAVGSGATIAGTSTTPGTSLTISVAGAGPALTLQGGSNSSFTLSGALAGTTPLIATTSGSGQSLNVTGADTVNVSSNSLLPTANSTFRLFSYTGTQLTGGQFSNFSLGTQPNSNTLQYSYALSNQPGHVDLIVTPLGLSWAGVDDPAGAAAPIDANWTTLAANNNWLNSSGASTQFTAGSQVIFTDNAGPVAVASPQNVLVQASGVSTTGVTFGPKTVLYTFTNASGTIGISGTGGLAFLGLSAAPVTFDSANSFSGAVLISSGQLNLGDGVSANNGNALGQSSGVTVSPGATLNLNSVSGSTVAFGNGWNGAAATGTTIPLAIGGVGTGGSILGALNSQSGKNTYAGLISIGSTGATIASTSTVNGDGLTLSGGINNTVNAISAAATLTFAGAGDTTVNSAITDTGAAAALSIALTGPGNLTLSGSNTYHGATTDPGLLILKSANALGNSSIVTISSAGGLVLNGSGTTGLAATGGAGIPLSLSGGGTGTTIPGTAFTSSGALTDVGTSGYGGPISLPVDATIAASSGGALTLSGKVTIGTGGMPQTLSFVGLGATTVSGSIVDGGSLSIGSIVVNDSAGGTVTFSGSNTYSGTTAVNSGALILANPNALGNTTSPVAVASNAALVLSGGSSSNPFTFGISPTTSNTISLTLAGAGTGAGGAANGATGALTGSGTSNTYAGPITINTSATIATAISTDVLNLNGAINSTGATTTLTGPGTINVNGGLNINTGGGAAGLVVTGSGTANLAAAVPIKDASTGGTVTMSGTGTLNLNASNSYTGGTTINSGLTVAATTFALGSGTVTLNGGILRVTTNIPQISGFGGTSTTNAGGGTPWVVNTTGTYATPNPINSNVLRLTDGTATGSQGRTAFFNTPLPIYTGFTAKYTYTPSGAGTRADGMTFLLQNDPRGTAALGGNGGSLSVNGITPSDVLAFNIYAPNTVGQEFRTNGGTGAPYTPTGAVNLNSGDPINVVLTYIPGTTTLNETLTDATTNATFTAAITEDLVSDLGAATALLGFTGADGGSVSTQLISNFSFLAGPAAPTYGNNLVLNAGASSTIDVTATSALPTVTMGTLTTTGPAASTLNVTATSSPANQAYGLTLGAVTLSNNITFNVAKNGTGNGTLTLGALSDGGSSRTVTVNGAGTVALSTATTGLLASSSINVGGNVVNTGNLVVSNTTGSPTGLAAVNVNSGGTLAGSFLNTGTGSIAGLVTVNSGGTILGSNVAALAGTPLTLAGGLTFAGTSNASFALSTTAFLSPVIPNSPMINLASTLTITGNDTVKLTGTAPTTLPPAGKTFAYELYAYQPGTVTTTTNGSGTVLTFTTNGGGTMTLDAVANLPSNAVYGYKLVNDTADSQIDLVLTATPLTWTGATNGNWDIATTNWASFTNTATTYVNGAAVQFLNKNPITNVNVVNTTVTITPATGVQPGNVAFGNTGPGNGGVNYTIQNAAGNNVGIGGTTPVAISGAGGQVTFAGANSFSGPLAITAGQLNLTDAEAIAGVNYSLGLGNASGATVSSGATLQLTGAAGAPKTFGQGYNGGGLVAGSLTTPIGLTLNGTGQTGGALNSTTGNNTYVGPITLGAGGATIASNGVPANGDALTLSGVIGDGGIGSPGAIVISGGGITNITNANTYFGTTTVNSGTTVLSNAAALGNSSGATVNSGGTLALTGGTVATPLTYGNLAAGGGTIGLTLTGTGTSAGTFANTGALANSGVNTYAGPVTINSPGATIATTAAADVLTVANGIGGSGVLTAAGPGTLNVGAANTYAGGTIVNATGTVIGGSTGAFGTNTLTLNAGTVRVTPLGNASINGFGGNGTNWTQNGTNAGTFINSNVMEVTNIAGTTRSAFLNTPVAYQAGITGFTASFTYQFIAGSSPPADGITFTLHNAAAGATALGGGGGQLGYAGITPSASIQFNIYPPNNPAQASPADGGTFFGVNGAIGGAGTNISTLPVSIASQTGAGPGDPISVTLVYNPTVQTLLETLNDASAGTTFSHTYTGVNLASVLGNNGSAFVGFTGATGGSQATENVSNFSYTNGLPVTYPNTVLGAGDTSTIDVSGATAGGPAVTFGALTVNGPAAGTLNVTDATDVAGAAFTVTFGATTLNGNVTFNVANAALGANGVGTLTLGAITGGANSLTKTGAGTLLLSATSSYTGGTTVSNGTLTTTADNAIGNGALAVNAATGITSVVNVGGNQAVTSLASTMAGTGTATLNVASGTTLTDTQTTNTTFAGKVALASTATLTKPVAGTGTLEINGAPSLGANSIVNVNGGSLKFNVATGSATVGAGVTVNVTGTATLELANTVSALSDGTAAHSAQIINNSTATAGLLVSGTTSVQKVGAIDGAGTTQVNAGDSLTANHIIQGALVIGGTGASAGLVTIDASDASGNPLAASGGLALAGSVAPDAPFASGTLSSSSLPAADGTSSGSNSAVSGGSALGSVSPSGAVAAVPEPSTLLLLVLGCLACFAPGMRRRFLSKPR